MDCNGVLRRYEIRGGSEKGRDDTLILVSFASGGSVEDLYRGLRTHLTETEIQVVNREAMQGLAYLMEQNKMHRDIKV